jgi:hypothetical protein
MALINTLTYAGPFPVIGSYNSTTHQLDDTGSTHELISQRVVVPRASSAPTPTVGYSAPFLITAWSGNVGGYRTLTVTSATHGLPTVNNINVQIFDGTNYDEVVVDRARVIAATGDVELRVTDGDQFAGRISLS